jgi:urease accessory protein
VLLATLMTTMSGSVWAHAEAGQSSGLVAGLLHPVSGLDHVIAMIAVGLWGAQLGRPALWVLPVAFPMVMAVGGFLGLIGVHLPGIELGIALSGVILGLAVMNVWRPPLAVALALVAGFAIFHGHAHGVELPEGANGLTYSLGFVMATGLLHGAGIALGLIKLLPRGDLALRGMGAAVSLGGVYFLHGALV